MGYSQTVLFGPYDRTPKLHDIVWSLTVWLNLGGKERYHMYNKYQITNNIFLLCKISLQLTVVLYISIHKTFRCFATSKKKVHDSKEHANLKSKGDPYGLISERRQKIMEVHHLAAWVMESWRIWLCGTLGQIPAGEKWYKWTVCLLQVSVRLISVGGNLEYPGGY